MLIKENVSLYSALQKMIPGLPDRAISARIELGVGVQPRITVEFMPTGTVMKDGDVEIDVKTFEIREIDKTGVGGG